MEKKKCHKECPYSRYCYREGSDKENFSEECTHYEKIGDILWDAEQNGEKEIMTNG